jgi:hypothetical protein
MNELDHPKLQRLKKLSVLMDSKFEGPMGFRFGWDGIIGLVPVLGDFISIAVSLYIVFESAMLGCTPAVLLRMGLNLIIETIVEMIPVLGNIFDFVWKANNKNIQLLETHLVNAKGATLQARLVLGLIAFTLLAIFIGSVALTIYIFGLIFQWVALFSS